MRTLSIFSSLVVAAGAAFTVIACGGSDVAIGSQDLTGEDTADGGKTDAGPVSCESVGGQCAGLATSSCKGSGHWADADKVSCGAGIGVGC